MNASRPPGTRVAVNVIDASPARDRTTGASGNGTTRSPHDTQTSAAVITIEPLIDDLQELRGHRGKRDAATAVAQVIVGASIGTHWPTIREYFHASRRRAARGARWAEVTMHWLLYAFISAGASAVTAILAKVGVEGVPSTLATAIRTAVVLVVVWMMVFALNEQRAIPALSKRSVVFLVLSGIATGAAWFAYFRALQLGPASRVAPIDKLSLPLTILLASLWLGEPLSWRLVAGVILMTTGALLTIV